MDVSDRTIEHQVTYDIGGCGGSLSSVLQVDPHVWILCRHVKLVCFLEHRPKMSCDPRFAIWCFVGQE